MKRSGIWFALLLVFALIIPAGCFAQTFTNPILPEPSADPSIVLVNGTYYSVHSGCRVAGVPAICIRASNSLPGLGRSPLTPVWVAPLSGPNAKEIWAPQIEHLDGKWYIYYAADPSGKNDHTLFALVPKDNQKPLGAWQEADTGAPGGGFETDWKSRWAIDPMVYKASDNRYYMLYACRQDNSDTPDGNAQSICLAPMSDPLHLIADPQTHRKVVELSLPTQSWERRGWPTQEGPFGLVHGGKDYILYSGSFSGNADQYTEGVLINDHSTQSDGGNPFTNPAAWIKQGPIFDGHHASYGTASSVLVNSPDGTELWHIYHGTDCLENCVLRGGKTWIDRSGRAQKAGWTAAGELVLGYPVDIRNTDGTGSAVPLAPPSTDNGGTALIPAWGAAYGDAAENDTLDGLQVGEWTTTGATSITSRSLDVGRWNQSFFGSNPNYLEYIVFTKLQLLQTGVGDSHPKFGVYGAYVDHNNWFAAMLDVTSCGASGCLTTGGKSNGLSQPWLNCPLPSGFQASAVNTLVVEADRGKFTISLNGEALAGACQGRSLDLSAGQKHASNGQAGVLVENSSVAFTAFDVSPGVPLDSSKMARSYVLRNRATHLNLDTGCNGNCKLEQAIGSGVLAQFPSAQYPRPTSQAQLWRFREQSDGTFALENQATGLCMELTGPINKVVQNGLTQERCSESIGQRWAFVPVGQDSSFLLQNSLNKFALYADVAKQSAEVITTGRLVNGSSSQHWQLLIP